MDILRIRKDDLIQQAADAGVNINPEWTKRQIADAIEEAQSPVDTNDANADEGRAVDNMPSGVRNISGQRWMVYSRELAPGDTYAPTAKELSDKRGTAKVERAVNMGKLEYT